MNFSWALPPKNPPVNPNYQYILDKAKGIGGRFLDFGCGAGDLVVAGRKAGLSFYGAEVFYKGGDTRREVEKKACSAMLSERSRMELSHFRMITLI